MHWLTCLELRLPPSMANKDDAPPKSAYDAAAAEIKKFREETPLPLPGNI